MLFDTANFFNKFLYLLQPTIKSDVPLSKRVKLLTQDIKEKQDAVAVCIHCDTTVLCKFIVSNVFHI